MWFFANQTWYKILKFVSLDSNDGVIRRVGGRGQWKSLFLSWLVGSKHNIISSMIEYRHSSVFHLSGLLTHTVSLSLSYYLCNIFVYSLENSFWGINYIERGQGEGMGYIPRQREGERRFPYKVIHQTPHLYFITLLYRLNFFFTVS